MARKCGDVLLVYGRCAGVWYGIRMCVGGGGSFFRSLDSFVTVNRSEAAGGIVSESFRVGLVFENLFDRPVLDRWNIHLWEWGVSKTPTKLLGLNSHTYVRHYEYKMRLEGCCWPTGSFNIDATCPNNK